MRRPLSLCLALLAACTGLEDATEKPPPQVKIATLEQYTLAEQNFGCLAYVCLFGIAPSESTAFCAAGPELLRDRQAAVAQGRLAFDAQQAATCIERLSQSTAGTCWGAAATPFSEDLASLDAACAGVLTGKVVVRDACVRTEECADGWCDASAQVCPGHCAAKAEAGAACEKSEECQAGLSCAGKKCVAPAADGAACSSAQPCAAGLLCFDGRCDEPKAKGEPCDPDSGGCAAGFYCRADQSSSSGGLCAETRPKDAACEVGAGFLDIRSPACAGSQTCAGWVADDEGAMLHAGTCQPPSDVGGPCVPAASADEDQSNTGCFLGLVCDAGTKTCRAQPGPGGACPTGGCNQASYCEAATKTCQPLRADGEPCEASGQCQHSCRTDTHLCGPAILTCHAG